MCDDIQREDNSFSQPFKGIKLQEAKSINTKVQQGVKIPENQKHLLESINT
jgi:hypothetical protein